MARVPGEVSTEELGSVLVQAMLAQKNLRPQLDLLLQLRRRLEQQPRPCDDNVTAGILEFALDVEHVYPGIAAGLNDIAAMTMGYADLIKHLDLGPAIFKVYFAGVRAGARAIHTCLQLAAKTGACLARLNPAFAAMPEDELFDALVAQRLPARPTTHTEAFDRIEAAFFALKLSREHHLPRCVEHLSGGRVRPPALIGEYSDGSSEDEDDPVEAATEHLAETDLLNPAPAAANTDLSDPAPAAAAAATVEGEPPRAAARRSVDHDKVRTYLDRACTLWSLAVEHIDLAVAVFSSFLDPKEVASLSDYTDRVAYAESVRTDRLYSL